MRRCVRIDTTPSQPQHTIHACMEHARTRPDAEPVQVLMLLHADAEALWWRGDGWMDRWIV